MCTDRSASAPETSKDSGDDSVKEEVTDLMKRHMEFSNMTSCTSITLT